ncbi:MAG: hypothetical protein SFV51_13245 [Bryobacteraceae bacterium]|nr:hypothetical protein [Bryobacteraceae bacterium]
MRVASCCETPHPIPLGCGTYASTAFALWRRFGSLLCVENMDKRKAIGRTARELNLILQQLPEASFCFDIGHLRQAGPTMTE